MCFRVEPRSLSEVRIRDGRLVINRLPDQGTNCCHCGGEIGENIDLATGEFSCNCRKTFAPDFEIAGNTGD